MSQPSIITVILNTNRREDTLEALGSLVKNSYTSHKSIVLDNASRDGSVQAIGVAFPAVEIIELKENRGYTGNNNVGIQAALAQGADWVLVLNEDTVLAPDCLENLVCVGQSDPGIGILGPMVYHFDEPQVIQSAGGRMSWDWGSYHIAQNEPDRGQYTDPHPVDYVSGCAIMVRRAVIEQVGPLDERFFYYWEETEWCLRARKAGWRIVHVPKARVWHKGVQRNYTPGPSVTYYDTRNRFLMMSKHHAPLGARIMVWQIILRRLISWSLRPKWRYKHEHRDALWQGILDFLRHHWGMRAA